MKTRIAISLLAVLFGWSVAHAYEANKRPGPPPGTSAKIARLLVQYRDARNLTPDTQSAAETNGGATQIIGDFREAEVRAREINTVVEEAINICLRCK